MTKKRENFPGGKELTCWCIPYNSRSWDVIALLQVASMSSSFSAEVSGQEASDILAAALEQMDGIIASMSQIFSYLKNDA